MNRGVLACGIAVTGCVERVQLDRDDLPGLVAIEVSPGDDTVTLVLPGTPQTLAYRATGRFAGGEARDITDGVEWTVDNRFPGSLAAGGLYTTSNAAAGHVAIRASHRDITGAAALTVAITAVVVDDSFPPPAGAADLFAPGTPVVTDANRAPAILYPSDATVFPQGMAQILFQYRAGMMTDAFRLAFDSDVLHLQVLSGTDRWRPDASTWALLEQSHPGASARFEVDAASSAAPGMIFSGAPASLGFASGAASGALYYVAAGGILRGELAQPVAAKLYPQAGDNARVAAPSISLDGTTMALAYNDSLRTLDLATLNPITTAAGPIGSTALSPDGGLVVVANMGMLQLRDARTGDGVGAPDGRVMLGAMATHPDWSPDGKALAVAVGTKVTNTDLKAGSIARVPYLGNGQWGAPQVLVASTGDMDNNFFPRWSPDGAAIAYVHTAGPIGDPSAELRIVPAGGGSPAVLQRASHRVALDDVPGLASSMPAWAQTSAGTMWLAFVSGRPYGAVRPMPGGGQIWISAIDPARLGGGDPSAAAFWVPAQDVTTAGASPAWAPATPPVIEIARSRLPVIPVRDGQLLQ
jgi:hypothetical protein